MIRYRSSKQLTLAEFDWPFETALNPNNCWVKLGQCIPWDELTESYYQGFSAERGRRGITSLHKAIPEVLPSQSCFTKSKR
jgi:hypothetical protein